MAQSESSTKKTYHVGIICALATEKAAMEAMLDEEHPKLRRPPGDENDYTFGRIGEHNVAIACLPAGVTGTVSAATVARDMMRSFPIKIGLMVGIAGGVPSKGRDIRLGDVVVSQPTEMHGGVVQWDFGKMEKGGTFRRTGTLNKPPRVLLGVLQTLQAIEMRRGTRLPQYMQEMFEKNPRMKKTFCFQGSENDQLFEADYQHGHGADCSECQTDRTVERAARDEEEPVIHYGNIASGDEVMKDGPTRDAIAKKENVICFEMEAAGLADSFPCVVVRGICDYADSHKNKRWQPYAAVTAAAYAKWLLKELELSGVEELPNASSSKFNVPFSLDGVPSQTHFVGREQEMSAMEKVLQPQAAEKRRRSVFVIHGLGGIGKTQLAVQYARKHKAHYSAVIWVNGNTKADLHRSLLSFIGRIPSDQLPVGFVEASKSNVQELSDEESSADIKGEVLEREFKKWLSAKDNANWLMIVDNLDTEQEHFLSAELAFPRVLDTFPPGENGSIIITTRLVLLKSMFQSGLKLTKMNDEDARAVLQQRLNRQDSDALLATLKGLPLALAQAGAYIEQTGITTATYLDLYQRKWLLWMDMQARFPLEDYGERSVLTTWNLSYDQVVHQCGNAAALLRLWSFLDCNDICHRILQSARRLVGYRGLPYWIQNLAQNEISYIKATGTLHRYSLIDRKETNETGSEYVVHAVLHEWSACLGTEADTIEMCWLAVRLVGASIPKGRSQYRSADRQLLPHILQLFRRIQQRGCRPRRKDEIASIVSIVGVLVRKDRFEEARAMIQIALEEAYRILDPDDSTTLSACHHMGWVEAELGNIASAMEMYQRALDGKIRHLGCQDPSTLKTIRNLGALLSMMKQYEDALTLYTGYVPFLDPSHGELEASELTSAVECDILDSFGCVCMMMKKCEEASRALRTALEAKEHLLGADHISTLETVRNYALFKKSQHLWDEAECLLRRCLRGQTNAKLLGPDHPDTIRTTRDLGQVLARSDQHEALEKFLQYDSTMTHQALNSVPKRKLESDEFDLRLSPNELARLQQQRRQSDAPVALAAIQGSIWNNDSTSGDFPLHEGPSFHAGDDIGSFQPSTETAFGEGPLFAAGTQFEAYSFLGDEHQCPYLPRVPEEENFGHGFVEECQSDLAAGRKDKTTTAAGPRRNPRRSKRKSSSVRA